MKHKHDNGITKFAGKDIKEAKRVMILLHGRGGNATGILELADQLAQEDMAFVAPQATDNTWYPYSFMAPMEQNEPFLSDALQRVQETLDHVRAEGFTDQQIYFGGFSQGACLASEFVARNAAGYGGLLVYSGGLIGPEGTARNYDGSLSGVPIFLGCSDVDAHVPKERVNESTAVFMRMGAEVTEKIYPGMPHTINEDEIEHARRLLDK